MSREERDAIMARLKVSAESSRRLDAAMRSLGAPTNWRDVPPEPVAVPVPDAWGYGSTVPQGEVSFADRAERLEQQRQQAAARRRRADTEVAGRDRLFGSLRDLYGLDEAERMMRR
ncbi:hypothetical protein [Actinocorallia longicatena]|uniref:Uncharacterized protein n=1 Tax=Actinocorallia longicatena TaxID=111803 RepID=A0ABP6QDA6_9ACTN